MPAAADGAEDGESAAVRAASAPENIEAEKVLYMGEKHAVPADRRVADSIHLGRHAVAAEVVQD